MAGHEKANAARAAACRIGGDLARNKRVSFARTIDAGPLSFHGFHRRAQQLLVALATSFDETDYRVCARDMSLPFAIINSYGLPTYFQVCDTDRTTTALGAGLAIL